VIETRLVNLDSDQDASAVIKLLTEYAATMGAKLAASPRDTVTRLQACGNSRVWLAFEQDQPVGCAIGFITLSTFAGQAVLNIHDLAVAAECRGRGVGSQLLGAVRADAVAEGCCQLTLEVREDNPRAERLYRRFGFSDPSGHPTRFLSLSLLEDAHCPPPPVR
jgi:ribosomal protein S18 acetylase RimI-like enzyme